MPNLKIEIDVKSVQQAEKTTTSAFSGIESAVAHLDKNISSLESSIKEASAGFSKLGASTTKPKTETLSLKNALKNLENGLDEVNKGMLSANGYSLKYAASLSRVKSEIRKASEDSNVLSGRLDKLTSSIDKADAKSNRFEGTLKTIRAAAIGYATVLATMEIQQFISSTIDAGVQVDSLRRSFKAITGDEKAAAEEMAFVENISETLGLELVNLQKSYKGILAASKGTSLEGKEVQKVFSAITKASSVLGMTTDETEGALRALSQMISKGNVQAEELRGQLGERLPGAFKMAAEAMGVSTEKLNDMLENGEVLAVDLLPKLAAVLEGRFADAAIESADSAQAHFNILKNEVTELKVAVGESGLIENLTDLAKEEKRFLETNQALIKSNLNVFFDITTISAKVLLHSLSGIANKLDQIGKFSGWTAELIHGTSDFDKAMSQKLAAMQARINVLKEAIELTEGRGPYAEEYKKELDVLLRKRKLLVETYRQEKEERDAVGSDLSIESVDLSSVYKSLEHMEKQKEDSLFKIRETFRQRNLDDIDKTKEKEIKKVQEWYDKEKAVLLRNHANNDPIFAELRNQAENEINTIIKNAQDKRQELLNKENEERSKIIKKGLDDSISDALKAQKALESSLTSGVTQTPEIIEQQEKLRSIYKKGTEDAKTRMQMFGIESPFALDAIEQIILKLQTLSKEQKEIEATNKRVDKALESFFKDIDSYEIESPLDDYIDSLKDSTSDFEITKTVITNGLQETEDAFVELMKTGSLSFQSLIDSILEDLIRYTVQASITLPIAKALNEVMTGEGGTYSNGDSWAGSLFSGVGDFFSGFFSEKGNVVSGNSIHSASNTIVSKPTFFPGINKVPGFATGGVVGEGTKPEAILPLTRTSSGDLGVQTSGSMASGVNIEMNITNKTNQNVAAKQDGFRWDASSKKMILSVILEAAENNTGNFRTTMKGVVSS